MTASADSNKVLQETLNTNGNISEQIQTLAHEMQQNQPVTVLTGAGISVSSGLPVYRDAEGSWIHKQPVQGPKFRASESTRQRYWCRSYFGWQAFSKARPNSSHNDLARLEEKNFISTVITQNVDGLHQQAGSKQTIALHGNLSEVICLSCGDISARSELQTRLKVANPEFLKIQFEVAPDGDALVDDAHVKRFNIVACAKCNGTLQPHVVFYGDNVPRPRVDACMQQVLNSRMLLCIGTSLMVFSGFRFCRAAAEAGIPVVMINKGITRADDLAELKINSNCDDVLSQLAGSLV